MLPMAEQEDLNELWMNILDSLKELGQDVKGNRRALRHLRMLEILMNEMGNELTKMARGKKGFLR
jgi:hypothetical protein